MKNSKLFLFLMLILPWLTIPFMGKRNLKRFMVAGLLISLVVWIESIIANSRNWWRFRQKIIPNVVGTFPFICGPFYIGSMWILKWTYGKFYLYSFLNLIIDSLFTYPFVNYLENNGIAYLIKLKKYQLSLLFFIKSLLLYGFQNVREKFVK